VLRRSLATVGTLIAERYRITGRIGSGSMASIYLAIDIKETIQVAVKLLHPNLADDEVAVRRFEREAKAASGLHHDGVVHVSDWGFQDEIPFIVMDLVPGEDLYVFLQRHGRLSQKSTINIGRQLCDVLDAAHSMGLVHRDLKPENIMVVATEGMDHPIRVKVLDFGVVKFLPHDRPRLPGESMRGRDDEEEPDSSPASLTQFGMTVGTPTHMAPEQARSGDVDTRADLYTTGVLLFEMSTGTLPFDAPNPIEVARMHVKEKPPSLRGIVSEIHPELESVILRCLEKDPSDRWQTARELGRQLARVAVILDTEGDPTAERYTPSAPLPSSLQLQRSTMPTFRGLDDDERAEEDDGLSEDDANIEVPHQPLPPVDLAASGLRERSALVSPELGLNPPQVPSMDVGTAPDRSVADGRDSTVRSSAAIVIVLLVCGLGAVLAWLLL